MFTEAKTVPPARPVWIASAVWAVLFAALNWWRWTSYHANGDFSLFVQTIVSGFPKFHNTVEDANHFAVHFSPIYAVFTPILRATHSVGSLFVAPAIAGALAAAGVFFIARRLMPDQRAAGVASVAFLYPPLAGLIFGDPFENVFAPAATIWLLYAIEMRNFGLFAFAAVVALAIKEDQGFILSLTGVLLAYRYRRDALRMRLSLALAAVSVVTALAYFVVIRPHVASAGWSPAHFYNWSAAEQVTPWSSPARLAYVLEVFVPLLFIPFRSSAIVFAAAPFAELLASSNSILFTNGTHYAGVWIGYVLVAYVYGIAGIASVQTAKRLIAASAAICALQLVFASPTHWRVHLSIPDEHDRMLSSMLAALPQDARIATFEEAYAHLGFSPLATIGLHGRPAFIVVDSRFQSSFYVPILRHYVNGHPEFRLRHSADGIDVYERTP